MMSASFLTFQSAYLEHLVKSVTAFVLLASEVIAENAPPCRTSETGHGYHW